MTVKVSEHLVEVFYDDGRVAAHSRSTAHTAYDVTRPYAAGALGLQAAVEGTVDAWAEHISRTPKLSQWHLRQESARRTGASLYQRPSAD